jgi:hypothetical protein
VPEQDDVIPIGPLGRASMQAERSPFTEAATAACSSSDLLLTLAPLDPALGGEHLATWTADAVVVVTAGRSSWTKIHAAGEMVRLAGTRVASAVLVDADKSDDSLGVIATPEGGHDAQAIETNSSPNGEDSFITLERSATRRRSDYS